MNNRITKRLAHTALLASLIGFSSLSMAQSNAVEALHPQEAQNTAAAQAPDYPEAQRLAKWLDQYNRQDNRGRVPETHVPAGEQTQHVSRTAQRLSEEIDAYYAHANDGRIPQTHMPAGEKSQDMTPMAERLAEKVTRYNNTGGSSLIF